MKTDRAGLGAAKVAAMSALGICTVLVWCRCEAGSVADGGRNPAPLDCESQTLLEAALEGLSALAPAERGGTPTEDLPSTRMHASADGCVWWDGVSRNNINLAARLGMGGLRSDLLWRHELLNRSDRAPCEMDRKALEDLVGSINVQLDPVVRRLEVVKLDEIAEAVRDNKVPEFAPNPMSDNTLRMRATIIVEARLEAGIPAKLSEVLDELRATKPLQPPAESYAIVGGKYYLQSSLPVLPRSQAMQQAVSVCVSQALMTLMGFFVQRGYSYWDERLESALQAAFDGGSPHSVR